MYFFIAIIFIAELIIAGAIVCSICKLDRKVTALSDKVAETKPKIQSALESLHKNISETVTAVKDICIFIEKQRARYIVKFIQNILAILLMFMLRGKSKKYLSAIELAISLGKIL